MIDDRDELARFRLDGRVAIVTGGTGGIGSRLCEARARVGAYVVVHGRDQQRAEALARRLSNEGGVASAAVGDMTRRPEADNVVETALANYGRVDALVTTVGGGAGTALHPAEAYPENAWDRIMHLSCRAPLPPPRAAARAMIEF